jgi:hypothetical protein
MASVTEEQNLDDCRNRIKNALNSVCMENGSNTPDYILAEYLMDCLAAFDRAVNTRDKWYGIMLHP